MATEIELKLYCPPEAIRRINLQPLLSGADPGPAKRLENTYFDTDDLALHKQRIALRVRRTPTEQLQTVKCAADSIAGLSSRPEWETTYQGHFDFRPVDDPNVRSFLKERQGNLQPVFTTDFERRTWRIDVTKKTSIFVMVDVGHISSGDQTVPISEIELELASGRSEDLLDFAAELMASLPLVPDNVSKAERGYRLFLNQAPTPQKAMRSTLTTDLSSAEAFRLLASQGLQMWQANLLGALISTDPGFVHQYRVSMRRLRSLLKVFRPALPERFRREWSTKLKELAQFTGDARDLDVMNTDILEPLVASENEACRVAGQAAMAACAEAKQDALALVQKLENGAPILLFARALQELTPDSFPKSLVRFAEKQLGGLHRKAVKRLGKVLALSTPENAHRFRIALKHLRYASEFFAPLFDDEEMIQYAKEIARLQDGFGFINDFHVALFRLQTWVDEGKVSPETRQIIAVWHSPMAQDTLQTSLHLAETVLSRCQPWCTECEQRGLSAIRRRLKHGIIFRVE